MEVLTEIAEYSRDYKMYPGKLAKKYEDRPAFIMASTGEIVTYKEFEARSNQLAHFFREEGLKKRETTTRFLWKIITGILSQIQQVRELD